MSGYAVDDVAGLFKHFLRQLPVPLIPLDIQSRLRDAMRSFFFLFILLFCYYLFIFLNNLIFNLKNNFKNELR